MRGYSLFLFIFIALFSCKKKEQTLGKELLDSSNYLNGITTDTFALVPSIFWEDSVITDNVANVVLGSYVDPKFGDFDASFYTQVRLAGVNPNFGNPATIAVDSMVVALEYAGYYGDLTAQKFEVFELSEALNNDSTYYAFDSKTYANTSLVTPGKEWITPNPLSNTVLGGDSLQAQLRISLDTNLARQWITEATSGSSTFASNENFQSYFKGLYIRTNNPTQSTGQGGVFYFNLNDPAAKITIYYKQEGATKSYDLLMNSTCADFSHVEINNTGYASELVMNNPSQAMQEFYAQAFGIRAKLVVPGLSQFTKKHLIHRAELTLPIQYQTGYKYKPGLNVSFATKKTANSQGYINTGTLGVYTESKKAFIADLKSYIQAVVNQDIENTGLIISPRFFVNSSERIVFNGPTTINKESPKLLITYTTF